ncbi:MAG: hypothetical protein A3K65_08530 [Euryarchaeota archaeon RBG_16_68_12]|nr:MAG: hypothetical protein A3K65_08530 [Euryarchaeota archaeon RBG_16_68_12]
MAEEGLVRNYNVEYGLGRALPPRIQFWDETMRDGEQTPGVYFSPEEKLQIATVLSEMGVHVMNVGIPVVSKEEHRGVKLVANAGLKASIMAACRAVRKDLETCIECDVDEVSIFIACSDLHLKYKLNMTREQVREAAVREVEYAKAHGVGVTFVTEDTFRADFDYVVELYSAAIGAGATRAVFCDTVGYTTPTMMREFIGRLKKRLPPVQLSVHCHNDFGLAVANSLAALEAGVEVPHTCVNGLGERSGNASFEELVMALEVLYGYRTGIDVSRIAEVSRLVETLSGIPLAVNKAIVGYNSFSHESGIHADGVIKMTSTYEPMQPERVGRERRFIFGKHTGSAAVEDRLKKNGIRATPEQVRQIVEMVKDLAENRSKEEQTAFLDAYRQREEKRRGVSDSEFWGIVRKVGLSPPPEYW